MLNIIATRRDMYYSPILIDKKQKPDAVNPQKPRYARYNFPITDREIFELWSSGLTMARIAKRMGYPPDQKVIAVIHIRLKKIPEYYEYRKNKELILGRKRTKNIDLDAVYEKFLEGKTTKEIANEIGVKKHILYYRIKNDTRFNRFREQVKREKLSPDDIRKIIELYYQKVPLKEIGIRFGFDPKKAYARVWIILYRNLKHKKENKPNETQERFV